MDELLQKWRGLSSFRPFQRRVLQHLAQGQSVFALASTGSGKSLCYEWPAKFWGGKVLVISPLQALMEDQYSRALSLGISTVCLHSGQERERKLESTNVFWQGDWQLAFISPERLAQYLKDSTYHNKLQNLEISLLCLEEAHCFVSWLEFRPAYSCLLQLLPQSFLVHKPWLALSATLSKREALKIFSLKEFVSCSSEFIRPQLGLATLPIEEEGIGFLAAAAFANGLGNNETLLAYCPTRKGAEELDLFYRSLGLESSVYHAGLPTFYRQARLQDFRQGRLRIVCASEAFGMGIDYPRVRRVLHFGLPYSLSSYWQAVGRGGRDGEKALALALYTKSDLWSLKYEAKVQRERLAVYQAFTRGQCLQRQVARFFGLREKNCGSCMPCLGGENFFHANGLGSWEFLASRAPWWTRKNAQSYAWLRKRIHTHKKFSLDALNTHDSVFEKNL